MNSKEGEEEVKKKFEEFVERNKFRIGGILLLISTIIKLRKELKGGVEEGHRLPVDSVRPCGG